VFVLKSSGKGPAVSEGMSVQTFGVSGFSAVNDFPWGMIEETPSIPVVLRN